MKNSVFHRKLSKISAIHYFKLLFRSLLFLVVLALYIINRSSVHFSWQDMICDYSLIFGMIWVLFAAEMIARCFPSGLDSMGCQKLFSRNYIPVAGSSVHNYKTSWKVTLSMAAVWFALNGLIGVLYFVQIIDEGILLLISLAYSVCDMICILFFCPFQTWFMKNKCCGTCRIYNWDYAMMFTPLAFVKHFYSYSLLGLALILLLQWEIIYHKFPERFYDGTNQSLTCAKCQEKLCHHKKQLRQFAKFRR